jgi:hypothetical protein
MKNKNEKWIDQMDEDVPSTNSKSMYELERDLGHGFWGNSTTGYIYDKDTKEKKKRYKDGT